VGFEEASRRLRERIMRLVRAMREDYQRAHESDLVILREKAFKEFYKVSPIKPVSQSKNIVFVDAGFHSLKTNVMYLFIVYVGSAVRTPYGELRYTSQLGEYEFPEVIFIYGRWGEKNGKPWFTTRIMPLSESNLLFTDERAQHVSTKLTEHVNKRLESIGGGVDTVRLYKLFSAAMEYLEGLVEIAYGLSTAKITGDSLLVVDGGLARWFTIKSNIRLLGFDILDVLSILLEGMYGKEVIHEELTRKVYGLVKRPRFTAVARAHSLFSGHGSSQSGFFTYVCEESVNKAVDVINSDMKSKYSESILKETILLFNRPATPSKNLWITRFPITTDGNTVLFLEAYSGKPIVDYDPVERNVFAVSESVREVGERVKNTVGEVMAIRSRTTGLPPYGFMEIDEKVRVESWIANMIEDMIADAIREEVGGAGHPLEQLFGVTRRMRLGYWL